MNENLSKLTRLSEDDRVRIYTQAIDDALGPKPRLSDFEKSNEFPRWLILIVVGMSLVLLLAAFLPSSFRLYKAGHDTFCHSIYGETIEDNESYLPCQIVGISTILLAEIGQIVFFFSVAVLGKTKLSRRIFYGGVALSTFVALVGNAHVANPWVITETQPLMVFAILETFIPPILVMAIGYTLKELGLLSVYQLHEKNRKLEEAIKKYNHSREFPETLGEIWWRMLSRKIKDSLRKKNLTRHKDTIENLTKAEWKYLIKLEMEEYDFYVTKDDITPIEEAAIKKAQEEGNPDLLPDTLVPSQIKSLSLQITTPKGEDKVWQDPETKLWSAQSGLTGKIVGTQYTHEGYAKASLGNHNRAHLRKINGQLEG